MRGLTQPLNRLSIFNKQYIELILYFVYPVVLPGQLSQHAKAATADGTIDKKFNLCNF
jgi:hypothetical protein